MTALHDATKFEAIKRALESGDVAALAPLVAIVAEIAKAIDESRDWGDTDIRTFDPPTTRSRETSG